VPEDRKEALMIHVKTLLGMILLYVLVFAACCPWPFQGTAMVLLWVISLFCASIPAVLLSDRKGTIEKVLAKAKEMPNLDRAKWRSYTSRISYFYIPYIVLLFFAGQLTLVLIWLFCYIALVSLGREVIKRMREEGYFHETDM
jgi:hypothetical protein